MDYDGMHNYIHLSQYGQVCKNIYDVCKGDIENNVIKSLESEVERLKEHLNEAYKYR